MTDTMRERLARRLFERDRQSLTYPDSVASWEDQTEDVRYDHCERIDAILRELLDLPAEQWFQIEAELDQDLDRVSFDRALMYILDKGRTVKIPIEGKTSEVERPGDVVA